MPHIQFGVQYNEAMADVIGPMEFAEQMEALGYRSYFVPDIETLPALDAFVILAGAAQRTRHMRLGTGVLVLPFRSPYQLAKVFASLDVLSGGRAVLGLGVGGLFLKDFEVEGVKMEDRRRTTDERIELVQRLLTETNVTHHGAFHDMDDVTLQPRPIQRPRPPIWTGAMWNDGFAKHPLVRAARWADGFHPHGMTPQGYVEGKATVEDLAVSYGRDAAAFEWSCNMYLCMGPSKDTAQEAFKTAMVQRFGKDVWDVDPRTVTLGTSADCIETLEEFVEAGVTHFTINAMCEPSVLLATYEQFAGEVMSHFQRRYGEAT